MYYMYLLSLQAQFSLELGALLLPLAQLPLILVLELQYLLVCVLLCLPQHLLRFSLLLTMLV